MKNSSYNRHPSKRGSTEERHPLPDLGGGTKRDKVFHFSQTLSSDGREAGSLTPGDTGVVARTPLGSVC